MSSRSNYLLIQTPFYSLLTFPAPPSPRPNTSDKLPLPLPRQRTRKTRARGLSILIPPPTERLQKGIRVETVDARIRHPYPYSGLIFLCVGVVTLGFTMMVLVLIIPDQIIPIWQHHLHLST